VRVKLNEVIPFGADQWRETPRTAARRTGDVDYSPVPVTAGRLTRIVAGGTVATVADLQPQQDRPPGSTMGAGSTTAPHKAT
jgi:hypothetical protein